MSTVGLGEDSLCSMARHRNGESLATLRMQDEIAESGLLIAAGHSGDARQDADLLDISVLCGDGSGDKVFAVLRARFAKKLHTRLNSDDERFFITFRREKDQKLHAPQRKFQRHGGEA